ncbi:Y-box-binding protein 2-like [Grus americana]|uniref:Y-box-binding protein 2-like n=1 Tax=Grus americana TaxID=9117 RepID=UPI002407CCB2|nr:Y-box-binding protein 2-like [Grus americana]
MPPLPAPLRRGRPRGAGRSRRDRGPAGMAAGPPPPGVKPPRRERLGRGGRKFSQSGVREGARCQWKREPPADGREELGNGITRAPPRTRSPAMPLPPQRSPRRQGGEPTRGPGPGSVPVKFSDRCRFKRYALTQECRFSPSSRS